MATEIIKTITKIENTPRFVYNLEVEDNNNYFIEDILVHNSKIVIQDESCLIPDAIEATIFRMIAGKGSDAFYCKIGNPFYRNHFLKSSKDENYKKIFIDYNQGIKEGRYTQEFIEEAKLKPYFDVLFGCEFPKPDAIDAEGYSVLISEDDLYPKIKAVDDGSEELFGNLYLGCDVAGEGSNYSAITLRGRNGAKLIYKENNPDTMNFVGVIVAYAKQFNVVKIFVDKVGIGKPVFDRLKEIPEVFNKVIGVMAGESAENNIDFFNKRAEMFWRLKEWLATSYLFGTQNTWIDLLDIKYKIQSDKKVKIKSKDEMLSDGIQSPDIADSLSLTFYDNEQVVGSGISSYHPIWKGYNRR